jgi:hypothetical protein
MGYGIAGGVFQTRYGEDIIEDLIDQKSGKVIPKEGNYQIQVPKIADLDFDWSTIIKDGEQLQTVGAHWPHSRALTREMRQASAVFSYVPLRQIRLYLLAYHSGFCACRSVHIPFQVGVIAWASCLRRIDFGDHRLYRQHPLARSRRE